MRSLRLNFPTAAGTEVFYSYYILLINKDAAYLLLVLQLILGLLLSELLVIVVVNKHFPVNLFVI